MKTGQAGIALIKNFEDLVLYKYICPAGKPTIGYGHVIRPDENLEQITKDEAEALLRSDLSIVESCINNNVKVELNQNQFDALADFVFNMGSGSFRESTLLKKLNMKLYNTAAIELDRWNKLHNPKTGEIEISDGLTRRRLAEKTLFMSNVL